ncbi:MAG: hypothetical protein ACC628_10465 [Pirellulaceae bacterium]
MARFVVFGSFVTKKREPNDVDVFMIMDNNFDKGSLRGEPENYHGSASGFLAEIDRMQLISDDDGVVTFRARGKEKANGNKPEPFRLRGAEFVRRWAMHTLPKPSNFHRPPDRRT